MNIHCEDRKKQNAVILQFPRKRGRPKTAHRGVDYGTPELIGKRLKGETTETLDLCLERGIITENQHWCGVHLRWLHTLRHGVTGIRAIDPTHIGGKDLKADDPEWRQAREQEYHNAMQKLTASGQAALIENVCVYNQRLSFLTMGKQISFRQLNEAADTIAGLRDGLDILAKLWKR
jgi:hypothetical protein